MRKNNFDIVRLVLAALVVFSHAYDLSMSTKLAFIQSLVSSRLAVECFFVISGYLIFASYERCATLREYFLNRGWRILPGYWLSTLLCLGIAFAHGSFHVGGFLLANLTFLTFLHPGIEGVFMANPGNSAMNGALWTIKIEVMFYLAVPCIVWLCRRLHRDAVLATLFVGSLVYRHMLAGHESLVVQLPGQLAFFMSGALIYYHIAGFKGNGLWITIAGCLLFLAHVWTGWFGLRPMAVGILVLSICLLAPHVTGPTRWGDFSYGTYVLHYPIVQLLVATRVFQANAWAGLALTFAIVAVAAALSWNLVEQPALNHARSRRLRQEAAGLAPQYPPAVP